MSGGAPQHLRQIHQQQQNVDLYLFAWQTNSICWKTPFSFTNKPSQNRPMSLLRAKPLDFESTWALIECQVFFSLLPSAIISSNLHLRAPVISLHRFLKFVARLPFWRAKIRLRESDACVLLNNINSIATLCARMVAVCTLCSEHSAGLSFRVCCHVCQVRYVKGSMWKYLSVCQCV